MFRYGLVLAKKTREVALMLNSNWRFLRSYPLWLVNIYSNLEKYALKKGIKTPPQKIRMIIEGDINNG
jgi:hypothetical protein